VKLEGRLTGRSSSSFGETGAANLTTARHGPDHVLPVERSRVDRGGSAKSCRKDRRPFSCEQLNQAAQYGLWQRERTPGPAETVKRHPALARLSEEHHHELAHARRLLRAAEARPEQRLAAACAYVDAFFAETVEHFRREEEILFPLYLRHAGSTPVLERILREHMELHGLARALRAAAAAGDIAPETLRTLGNLLHDHVRVEERELFEEIERTVPAAELEGVRL
jgi:hemerythrin-like domain-containing protein